jgi:hypothetical protein
MLYRQALPFCSSERGVVFFRDAVISPEEQITLVDKLGKLGGKPADSGLHIHPLTLEGGKYGDEISVISNEFVFDSKFERPKRLRVKGDTLWVCRHVSLMEVIDFLAADTTSY